MHNKGTNFRSWSDFPTVWNKEKQQTILKWDLKNEGIIELPLVKQYKYLGIWFRYNLSIDKHLRFLKKKNPLI